MTKSRLILHFDGSCWPNPGGVAKYGWIIEAEQGDGTVSPVATGKGPVRHEWTSNNIAEWCGLRAALEWLSHYQIGVSRLTIVGDSQLVLCQLDGRWRCRKAHLAELQKECQCLLGRIGCPWQTRWVPRERNARADALTR